MIENLPVKTLVFKGLTIEGYSRAAVQSYWRIQELKIGFELGGSPWSFTGTQTIFVTHSHLDHLAAIPVYVSRRRMMKMEPPRIYLPAESVENVQRMLHVWQRLDRGRMVVDLVGVRPGDEIELSREHIVTAFPHQAHGAFASATSSGTAAKNSSPSTREKRATKSASCGLAGAEVTQEVRVPLLCFVGDSAPAGLDAYPPLYEATVLITEMTFFRPEHRKEKIHKFGHTHLDDILERADRFHNELIILSHFSTRYHERQIAAAVERRFPPSLAQRVHLWM